MLRAFFYDADGHDQEVALDECSIESLSERSLLWIDATAPSVGEIEALRGLLDLDAATVRTLLNVEREAHLWTRLRQTDLLPRRSAVPNFRKF